MLKAAVQVGPDVRQGPLPQQHEGLFLQGGKVNGALRQAELVIKSEGSVQEDHQVPHGFSFIRMNENGRQRAHGI